MKIYHNPRCSKSRATLEIIQDAGYELEVVDYLKNPPGEKELRDLLVKLDMEPEELVRKGEDIYKEKFKGKKMGDDDWIKAMVKNPILIERPIVVNGNRAILGRPPENVKKLF